MPQRVGYNDVYSAIHQEIGLGQLLPGSQLPSERELMDRFQVSRTTIRRAVDRLEEERRIVRKPGRGTFIAAPGEADRPPALLRFGTEVFSGDPYYASLLLNSLEAACSRPGVSLLIRSRRQLLESSDLDGILLALPGSSEFPELANRSHADCPVVLLNRIAPQPELACFAVDYQEMVYRLTLRLLKNGARNIAFVGGGDTPEQYSPFYRKRGWLQAFAEYGIAAPEHLQFDHLAVYHQFEAYCQFIVKHDIEVLLLGYGELCIHTAAALQKVGKTMGRDLDVICFDDLSGRRHCLPQELNYVKMPLEEIARNAVDYLLERHAGNSETVSRKLFRPQLLINDCRYLF